MVIVTGRVVKEIRKIWGGELQAGLRVGVGIGVKRCKIVFLEGHCYSLVSDTFAAERLATMHSDRKLTWRKKK